MPALLLQILLTPVLASVLIFVTRHRAGRQAGWIAAVALLYTTLLAGVASVEVYGGAVLVEEYLIIAPDIRLGLLADGLSVPTLAVILLLCSALAFYSIRYIEHRVEIVYRDRTERTQLGYYARFFYLFRFFRSASSARSSVPTSSPSISFWKS